MKIIALQKEQGGVYLENRKKDVKNSNIEKVPNASFENPPGNTNPYDDAIAEMYPDIQKGGK